MRCVNCGHEQEAGKFCGKCGNALQPNGLKREGDSFEKSSVPQVPEMVRGESIIRTDGATLSAAPYENVQALEKAKEASKLYWNYFLVFLKKPSAIFENSAQNFMNALISIAIFFIFTVLIIHNLVGHFVRLLASFTPQDIFSSSEPLAFMMPTVMDIAPNVFLSLAVLFALSFGAIFIVMKLMDSQLDLKKMVTVIGTLLIPSILVLAVSYLLLLLGLRSFGNSLFLIGLVISFLVTPIYAIIGFIKKQSKKYDALHAVAAYTFLFLMGSSICFSWFFKQKVNEALSTVKDMLSFMF